MPHMLLLYLQPGRAAAASAGASSAKHAKRTSAPHRPLSAYHIGQ
jgi:hypothetical protein